MRRYIIASHHLLAHGLKDTLNFLTSMDGIIDISAYMDDTDLPTQIKELFDSFDPEDEVVMMTDMLGGSVNQEAIKYLQYPNVYIITGMSLPIVLSIVLSLSSYDKVDETVIRSAIEDAKQQTVFVNDVVRNLEADDEDE